MRFRIILGFISLILLRAPSPAADLVSTAAITPEASKAGYRMKLSSRSAWPEDTVSGFRELAVSQDRAYVLGGQEIAILDVADASNPRKIGVARLGLQTFLTFTANGSHLFGVTVRNNGTPAELLIWDVVDPLNPVKTGSIQLSSRRLYQGNASMRVRGGVLFAAQNEVDENGVNFGALDTFDVSNPRQPAFLARYYSPSGAINHFALSGDRLYATAGSALEVIDISVPTSPKLLFSRSFAGPNGGYLGAIEVRGNHAYASGWEGTNYIGIFDLTDPQSPVRLARLSSSHFGQFKIIAQRLYAINWDRMVTFDISNPTNPATVRVIEGPFNGIDVLGTRVYAAQHGSGLHIYDASDMMADPTPIGTWQPTQTQENSQRMPHRQVATSGDYAYVTTFRFTNEGEESTLLVFATKNRASPILVSQMPLSEPWRPLEVHGDLLYNGATFVDVSNPLAPKITGFFGAPEGYAVAARLIYSAADTLLQITDVSNPAKPQSVGDLQLPPPSDYNIGRRGVKVSGNYAFVTGDSDLHVVDVRNPASPRLISTHAPSDSSLLPDLAVSGNHLYVGSFTHKPDPVTGHIQPGISVIDITDPAKPALIATHPFPHTWISSMKVSGRHLYIRRHESHMPGEYDFYHIFDIRDPRAIFQVAEFGDYRSPFPMDMAIDGESIFTVGSSFQIFSADYLPFLGVRNSADGVELNWPDVDTGFQLQQKTSLKAVGTWTNLLPAPTPQNGQYYLTLPKDAGAAYFRLQTK